MRSQLNKTEKKFREIVKKDKKVRNAYLLVHSDKLGISMNIAEGKTGEIEANSKQANHLASVGKLFTATIIGILHDKGMLNFEDKIYKYLDEKLMQELHVLDGTDHSSDISIKHLLTQTSGLNDVFYHLFKKIRTEPSFTITPEEAVFWGKSNLRPVAAPGKKHFYTDTNYYLLGLIIESITKKSFHEVVHELIFEVLEMDNAYLFGVSSPKKEAEFPPAGLFIDDFNCIEDERFAQIDYAGGSITAPLDEYLIFMKALVNHQIVKEETLNKMIYDDIKMGFPAIGFNYGYSVWKPKAIPLILPKKYFCWGCVGVTGAFMFYHPLTESYIIGTFNDISYTSKALNFMLSKIIKDLLKLNKNYSPKK